MPIGNFSLTNSSSNYANSTHSLCLFNVAKKLKDPNLFSANREEEEIKIHSVLEDIKCAMEKYDKKIEKLPQEDTRTFWVRAMKSLIFYSSIYSNEQSQEEQTTNARKFVR